MRRTAIIVAFVFAAAGLAIATTYTTNGNNSGDIILADAGGASNFQGAAISNGPPNQTLALSPSDGTHPGVVTPGGVIPGNQLLDGGWTVTGNETVLGDAGFADNVSVTGNETLGGGYSTTGATPQFWCTGNAECELLSTITAGGGSSTSATAAQSYNLLGSGDLLFVTSNTNLVEFAVYGGGNVTVYGSLTVKGDAGILGSTSAGYIASTTPVFIVDTQPTISGSGTFSQSAKYLGDGTTNRIFKLTGTEARSASGTSGTGTVILQATDGTNTCGSSYSCASDLNTGGTTVEKAAAATAGSCSFPAGNLVVFQVVETCGTTHLGASEVQWIGIWQ